MEVERRPALAIVDTDGLGAGVTDRLREQGFTVNAFHASTSSSARDRSGELGFANNRAAAWWSLREALDPASGSELELPDDDQLLGDLTAAHWTIRSGGLIQLEAKTEIRKRLGRSPDAGDAVVMAFWEEPRRRGPRMKFYGRAGRW